MIDAAKPRSRPNAKARSVPAPTLPEQAPAASAPAAPTPGESPATNPIGPSAPLDEAFVRALEADFAKDGAKAIAAMRTEKPTEYVKTVAALCAKEPTDPVNPLREMSDAELDRAIHDIAARAGLEIRPLDAARREGAAGDDGAAAG